MPVEGDRLSKLPTQPGVYLMKDRQGTILYVGKAKSLRSRVRQYFGAHDNRPMIPFLMAEVDDLEVIVVNSEKEALLLENTLIKQHQPKYNACLKDDKSYISLKINNKHQWPMIRLVRYKGRPKRDGLYFGPYSSAYGARQTLDLLNRLFPLRECSDRELKVRDRPCILYDMKRCCAPCVDRVSQGDYKHYIEQAIKFLKGKDNEILEDLYKEMYRASDALEFERAGVVLRTIRSIEKTVESQRVAQAGGKDRDVLGVFRQGDEIVLTQLLFRSGKLIGSESYDFTKLAQADAKVIESFILQHYDSAESLPEEILLPSTLDDQEIVAEILSSVAERKVSLHVPQRGDKLALIKMAVANSQVTFLQRKDEGAIAERRLLEMKDRFHLNNYPRRIECFDNSNISGTDAVAALVAFTDGKKDKNRYRKYKIRTVEGMDDYAYMREVLERRLRRGKDESDLPDLLIVDGGKGHLNIAIKVLEELDISTVDVVGLAKEEGRHDKGVTAERVFMPNRKDPISLAKHSPVLFLLQQIRDEAHRVAISFHRSLRSKSTLRSELDKIQGIGPAKRKALLKYFGSVKRIGNASEKELREVPGISAANAVAILQHLKLPKTSQ